MARKIHITKADKLKLKTLIDDLIKSDSVNKYFVKDLDIELDRAIVIAGKKLPSDVITMHSQISLVIDGEEEVITLVYPNEIDITENKISVLSPIGTAILGYREADEIDWKVPDGVVKILVKKVLYQPESSLDAEFVNI